MAKQLCTHKVVSNGHFGRGSPKFKRTKYFDPFLVTIIHSPNRTFVPSFREVRNSNGMVLQGFLMHGHSTDYYYKL